MESNRVVEFDFEIWKFTVADVFTVQNAHFHDFTHHRFIIQYGSQSLYIAIQHCCKKLVLFITLIKIL